MQVMREIFFIHTHLFFLFYFSKKISVLLRLKIILLLFLKIEFIKWYIILFLVKNWIKKELYFESSGFSHISGFF